MPEFHHVVYAAALLIAAIYILLPPRLAAASFISVVSGLVLRRAGWIWGLIVFAGGIVIAPMIWSVNIRFPRRLHPNSATNACCLST